MLLPARLLLLCAVWLAVHAQSTTQLGGDGQNVVVHNQQQIHGKLREMDSKMEGMDSKMEGLDSTLKGLGADVSTKQDVNNIGAKVDKLQQDLSTLECSSDGGGNEEMAKRIEDLKDDHVNIKTQLSAMTNKIQALGGGILPAGSCNSTGGQTVPCKVEGDCDRGWKKYGVNCYFLYPESKLRQDAYNYCQGIKSELASFADNAELKAVINMLTLPEGFSGVWVKGVRINGRWMWDHCVTEGLSSRCTYEPISDDLYVLDDSSNHGFINIRQTSLWSTSNGRYKCLCKYSLQ